MTIAFTAATGKIGTATLAAARERGIPIRALVRDPERLPGTDAVTFDFGDPGTHARALANVRTLVLVSPPSPRQAEQDGAVIAAARTAGVTHVIKVSGAAAETGTTRFAVQHRASEEHLRASGLAWTLVRPTFFMENLLGLAPAIAAGTYPAPTAGARLCQVALADVAAVLLAIARDPARHHGAACTPTGPAAETGDEIAAALAAAIGRDVGYVDVPEGAFRESLARAGVDAWNAGGIVEAYQQVRAGDAALVTDDVERLTGRAATSLTAWAKRQAFETSSR